MLWASLGALVASILIIVAGVGARDVAFLPWIVLCVVAVADIVLSRKSPRDLTYDLEPEIFVGETVPLTIALGETRHQLNARLAWPDGLSGADELSFHPDGNGGAIAQINCLGGRRGVWRIEDMWLRWSSRFGLFDFVPRLKLDLETRVVPNIRLVQSGEITTTVQSTLFGVKENRAIGEGAEFHQLREFVKGMDVKSIDWKRSARQRTLVAKELRAERNHHVIVALDNGYLMREEIAGLPKIDHAVTAALATAWAATIGGDLVGHYSYDVKPRAFAAPEAGRRAFQRLRSWSAELEYVSRETNHTLALTELNARTPKRSLIIIFTDFIDATSAELLIENIAILAKRHLLVFVTIRDPDVEELVENAPEDLDGVATLVAANQTISERRLVLERLTRLGVTVLDTKPNTITSQLISTYLDIKARELI